jgi:tripeptide aminopeptidase
VEINRRQLLDRFVRYVKIDTAANPETDKYPSSPGQRVLGSMLADELRAMGAAAVKQNEHALVYATIPSTLPSAVQVPVVAFNSHVDTSPEAPGANVNPQIIENYQGGDIGLLGDKSKTIRVAESPELDQLHGCTLITTDGTTLLGADDKAGVAIIMQAAETLLAHPTIPHGKLRILFTCDEEIGRGVDKVDLAELGADACYTLDGPAANTIDVETFSADLATVTIRGVNIHPAIAKDKMVNAIRAAGHFLEQMPKTTMAPECTTDRDGFLHPYVIQGGVDEVTVRVLLRDFDTENLARYAEMLRGYARATMAAVTGCEMEIVVTKQYRNLGVGLESDPRVADYAELAHQRLGRKATREIIRGGTDGSRLTELGLPTPNLSSGQHNLHSRLEWACLDEMVQAVEVVIELAKVWASGE